MKYGIKNREELIPILGHIKIGGRKRIEGKTSGGKPRVIPVKFDHFVVTGTDQDELGYIPDEEMTKRLLSEQMGLLIAEHTEPIYDSENNLIKTIQTISDDQLAEESKRLTRIVVMLPFDDPEQNLVEWLSVYDNDGCRCRGNNESAEYIDPRTGEVHEVRCPCNLLSARLSKNDEINKRPPHEKGLKPEPGKGLLCKATGVLYVILKQARTLGGLHVFRTTSTNSTGQLRFSMNQFLRITNGYLAGIPLVLELRAKKVSPGPGKKLQTAYVVMLTRKQADPQRFLAQIVNNSALLEGLRNRLASKNFEALPPPGGESPYDAFNIREEFYNPDGSVETDVGGEFISEAEFTEAPVKALESKTEEPRLPAAKPEEEPTQPLTQQPDEPPAKEASEKPQNPPKTAAPQEPATATNEAQATAQPQEPATGVLPDAVTITFGRFKPVDTRKPEGADESPAGKDSRRAFFAQLQKAGYSDDEIKGWLEALWKVQSSSSLKSWQVTVMLAALA